MNLLITGAKGQLGRELMQQAPRRGFSAYPVDLPEVDITCPDQIRTVITDAHISLVVNCAAFTQVDLAESQELLALKVNSLGPSILSHVCSEAQIPMIHISTDFVFDGSQQTPYRESDPVAPMGAYGRSKALGESAVKRILPCHVILRTSWLYALQGQNFVKTILRLGTERDSVRVVADQWGCPTCAADLAEAVLTIASAIHVNKNVEWGTYHYCGDGIVSWHEFAQAVLDIAGEIIPLKTRSIEPITTEQYPTPAKRPAYSALDCSRIRALFGIEPVPWRKSLEKTLHLMMEKQIKTT